MSFTLRAALIAVLCAGTTACLHDNAARSSSSPTTPTTPTPGTSNPPPVVGAPGLAVRPVNTTCVAGKRPAAGPNSIALRPVFEKLSFNQPLAMVQAPGDSSRWYVIEKNGMAYWFANDDATATRTAFINLTAKVDPQSEGGLLGIAFHPNYAQNGYVFLSYTTSGNGVPFTSVLSRFTVNVARTALDPASELPLMNIRQPYPNHNGGNIAFGKDGYLYFGLGDGGDGGDPHNHGQNTRTLHGAMLRIDVNVSDTELNNGLRYKIPPGNAFGGTPACLNGACPDQAYNDNGAARCAGNGCAEIFAWGLRNPWRWSFDRVTGDLWAGDVGQNAWEEVDLIQAGKNYGWNCFEGKHTFKSCPAEAEHVLPVAEYGHNLGSAITGSFVYRGSAIPALTGNYLFADFGSGRIWALADPKGLTPVMTEILDSTVLPASFAEGHDGELYVLDYLGKVYKIVPNTAAPAGAFPDKLSETGCADPGDPKQAAPGMIPYDLNAALWSDAASKRRWLALPNGANITVTTDGDWSFPPGSILRKDFYFDDTVVETRLLAHHTDGDWAGYSYEWNEAQTDATLVTASKTKTIGTRSWTFPAGECLRCHTTAAGRSLGPESAQLNRDFTYPGGQTANQLVTFNAIGLFATPQDAAAAPRLPEPAATNEPLDARAKAYLHANCSHCHRPGGPGGGAADLRYATAFADMHICDQVPDNSLGVADAKLFAPGDPARSIIALRLQSTDQNRMPPLASSAVDTQAVELIKSWISARNACM